MSGGARAGAGRKATPIDLVELEKLCSLQCSDEEIAAWFRVSVRTLQNRRAQRKFGDVMRRGKTRGSISVRRAQMRLVEEGNVPMIVWMGKNLLGQRDTSAGLPMMSLPPIETAQDVEKAAEVVTQAIGCGKIAPAEGEIVMRVLHGRLWIIETTQWEGRLKKLEDRDPVDLPSLDFHA
jgi:hypothetical protein